MNSNPIDGGDWRSQGATPESSVPTSSSETAALTGSANVGDWREEVYQKIKTMKDLYLSDLIEMYQKVSFKLQKHDSLPQQPKIEQIEKLRMFKSMLEKLMQVLQISKNDISLIHKEKLPLFEKQIMNLLLPSKPRKPPQQHDYLQQHPQVPQAQSLDDGANSQSQSMNNIQNLHQQQLGHQSHVGGQQLMGTQQRATPEVQTSSLDLTAQTSSANVGNWQEEVYRKIKTMKDLCFVDLNEMYRKTCFKLQQHDSLPQQPKIEQIVKLRMFKSMLERLMQVLEISKNNLSLSHKEKLPAYEKQVAQLLNARKLPPKHDYLQQHPQVPQAQSLDDGANSQLQSMNNLQNMHQQQLGHQSHVGGQQLMGTQQRATREVQTNSLDFTAQTGSANVGNWQEEVYRKIKTMKDLYFVDLNKMYQKISFKLQKHDSLPQQPKIKQIEKLKMFKSILERLLQVLQISKNNISLSHKEKLPLFEKEIMNLLNPSKPRKPPQLHGYQQQHPQVPQAQTLDGGVNSQLQSMNIPGSGVTMQQSNMTNMKHGSVATLSAVTSFQQSIPSSLQPTNLDSAQTSAPSAMQQSSVSSLQVNSVSAPHQANISAIQPQNGMSLLNQNVNNIHTAPNVLQSQHLKQQHEQQNSKQNIHNKQMLLQKHQMLQQQLDQQGQQPSQMHAHQMAHLQQLNVRSGAFPHHLSSTQRIMNQQVKPGASFPVTSPQLLNAVSPQINHHSSPQIDPQNVPASVSKGGTPMHSANSPFVPSPSTPLVPSPMPGDHEKPAVSSLSNAAGVGQHTNGANAAPQSLSIGTPGISPSPPFECAGPEGMLGNATTTISGKSSVTEQPIERLLRAVKSISPKAFSAAVSDIGSVVSMVDRIAGSAPGNGSRATVGEDLVAMTKCRLQAGNILTQDGSSGAKRMRRYTSAMPLHMGASAGSGNDSLKQLNGPFTPELESTATSGVKKARIEVNHALLEEIRDINQRLIDSVVSISDEDMSPSMAAVAAEGSEGTVIKCSYNAITLT